MSLWPEIKTDFDKFRLHPNKDEWEQHIRRGRTAMPKEKQHAAAWVEWAYANVNVALQITAIFGLQVGHETETVVISPGYGTELRMILDRGIPATGVDPDETAVNAAISLEIVPKERYLCATAQDYLSSREPDSLDFIVGLNLAPSFSNHTQVVYELAHQTLSQNGVLLLMGDGWYQPRPPIRICCEEKILSVTLKQDQIF